MSFFFVDTWVIVVAPTLAEAALLGAHAAFAVDGGSADGKTGIPCDGGAALKAGAEGWATTFFTVCLVVDPIDVIIMRFMGKHERILYVRKEGLEG